MATLSITARTAGSAELIKTQALAVLMPERKTLSPLLKALDKRLGGTVARSLHNGDFTGATGSHIWLPGADGVERVLLIGCGDPSKLNVAQSKKISEALSRALVASPAKDGQILMECLTQKTKNPAALMEQMSLSLSLAHYQYGQTLNKRKKAERALKKVAILPGALCDMAAARRAVLAGVATGQGSNLTRQLVNLPGNICTPKFLASEARRLARSDKNLTTTIVDERKMAELGMHSLLSVGNGSEQPSQLIIIKYQGALRVFTVTVLSRC